MPDSVTTEEALEDKVHPENKDEIVLEETLDAAIDTSEAKIEDLAGETLEDLSEEDRIETIKRQAIQALLSDKIKGFFTILVKAVSISIIVLIFLVFVVLALEIKTNEDYNNLEGYIRVNHAAPLDYKDEVPPELQKIIDNYNRIHNKKVVNPDYLFHGPNEKIMGEMFPEKLSNEDLFLILEYQKIGQVTRAGIKETALMNLSGLDLRNINFLYLKEFLQSNLRKTNFNNVVNQKANFRAASMEEASFINSDLRFAKFIRSKMSYSNFSGADLRHSDLREAKALTSKFEASNSSNSKFENANFNFSSFKDAISEHSIFKSASFEGVDFSNAKLAHSSFKYAKLRACDFSGADLSHVDFTQANLDGCNFYKANLEGAIFKDATVQETDFFGALNASKKQLDASDFLLGAKSLPKDLIPQRRSWKERF